MAGDGGPSLRLCNGQIKVEGRVTSHPTLKACPSKRKADGAHMSGWMNACTSSKKKAEGEEFEAPEKASSEFSTMVAGGEAVEAPTKVKLLMSHEDIESILNHKARGDSFKEFQARVAKEVEETGEFEVTEEHMKNVSEARAWIKEEFSNVRSQYPNLVWED